MESLQLQKPNVAILGFSVHFREAPFDDSDWEVWGINRLHVVTSKEHQIDRWFQLHDIEEHHGEDKEHLEFLKAFPGPVYLRQQDIGKFDIPNAVPFPEARLVDRFGGYFTNTISWLLAYAISLEPEALGIYGVDMAQDATLNSEYGHQRPSCEYFLGIAAGLGIKIHIPDGSDLLKASHLYAFEDVSPLTNKLTTRLDELGTRKENVKKEVGQIDAQIEQLNAQKMKLIAGVNQLDGAMQDLQYLLRNWIPQLPS